MITVVMITLGCSYLVVDSASVFHLSHELAADWIDCSFDCAGNSEHRLRFVRSVVFRDFWRSHQQYVLLPPFLILAN